MRATSSPAPTSVVGFSPGPPHSSTSSRWRRCTKHSRSSRSTDEREAPVPASVEALLQRGLALVVLTVSGFLLPWLAALHLHPAALLLAPALAIAGWRLRRPAGTALACGAGASCLLGAVVYAIDLVRASL